MSERDSEGVRERENGGGGARRGKQRTSLLGRRKRPHCGGAASERRGRAAWSPGRPDLRVRAAGCWRAPSTGRSGLGAAGAAGPGKRSGGSGRWGQAGAGTEMHTGRKRWLARARSGGRGRHGARTGRRERRPGQRRGRVAGAGLRKPRRLNPACLASQGRRSES